MTSVADAVAVATERLAANGIESPRREARLLVALAAGVEPGALLVHPETALAPDAAARLAGFLSRRLAREPYSRIIGSREFWSLQFALSPDTLDPRPDSETLIEAALAELADRAAPRRVLDLGTGTGCLLLALLSELPNATGLGVDILQGAVDLARRNAAALGLGARALFTVGRWGDGLEGPFDIILSNPPYIATAEIDGLAPEVARFEPRAALDGGLDGLDAYRALAPDLARLLAPDGFAVIEVGEGEADATSAILAGVGLDERSRRPDLSAIERCLVVARTKKTVGLRARPV